MIPFFKFSMNSLDSESFTSLFTESQNLTRNISFFKGLIIAARMVQLASSAVGNKANWYTSPSGTDAVILILLIVCL